MAEIYDLEAERIRKRDREQKRRCSKCGSYEDWGYSRVNEPPVVVTLYRFCLGCNDPKTSIVY